MKVIYEVFIEEDDSPTRIELIFSELTTLEKKILEEKEKNTYFGKKVDNILANVISTDEKYILALETALRIYNAKYNC